MLVLRTDVDAIKTILENSQGIEGLNVDGLLSLWEKNKEHLISDILGGKLIKEIPLENIYFEPSEEELKKISDQLQDYVCYDQKAQDFIIQNTKGFCNNKVVDTGGYNVPVGAKLSKAFKHLTEDKEVVREMQDILSEFIQKTKITGVLCLSAHPLDYLTASDNNFNWTTCHSLKHSNRAGGLSYLCDSSTLVCYIKSNEPTTIYGVEWNNKKWRVLLHFSEERNGVFAGKQYPMHLKGSLDKVREELLPWRFQSISWKHETLDSSMSWTNHYPVRGMWVPDRYLINQDPQALNYNDLYLNSFPYDCPEYIFSYLMGTREVFNVGQSFYCLKCGKELVQDEDCMLCPDCEVKYGFEDKERYGNCCICGERVFLDDNHIFDWRGSIYCDDCAEETLGYCNNCLEYFPKELMVEEDCCKWCWEDIDGN